MPIPLARVARLADRFDELTELMADPGVAADFSRLSDLDRERQEIEDLAQVYRRYAAVAVQIEENRALLDDADEEMPRIWPNRRWRLWEEEQAALDQTMRTLLLPKDPKDDKNVIVEIRAGTGGEEASLFAAELYRMYQRWPKRTATKPRRLSLSETGLGGLKEVVFAIKGKGAYSKLKYESGVHRVQRVPVTESAGRIHTSNT
jgi:peptide chain release factor 1